MKAYLSLKPLISILAVSLLLSAVACDDDEVTTFVPTQLTIGGPDEVAPGDTVTFTADNYQGESYTWTVPTPEPPSLRGRALRQSR